MEKLLPRGTYFRDILDDGFILKYVENFKFP
jgi:hypothetical protein